MKNLKIFIFANCQGRGIQIFLSEILEEYGDVEFLHIENYNTLNDEDCVISNRDFISKANVFIYQPLKFMNDDSTIRYKAPIVIEDILPSSCEKISFPYIYNNALWPIVIQDNGAFSGAKAIKTIYEAKSLEEIYRIYDRGELDFQFSARYEHTMSVLKNKEKITSIKISDYIENNISMKMLFLTQNHPTSDVFIECARRIHEIFIDRSIIRRKNINFEQKFINTPENYINLPGHWPIDQYSYQFFKFKWLYHDLHVASQFYKNIMKIMWSNANAQKISEPG